MIEILRISLLTPLLKRRMAVISPIALERLRLRLEVETVQVDPATT